MPDFIYKIIFLLFTLYVLIHSISYGIYEITIEKNKYGGSAVIASTIFSVVFGNIVIWIR